MGDNLAELLYKQYVTGRGWTYGSDEFPSWHNLDANERYAWERVAAKAREEMQRRFVRDMREAVDVLGAEQAIANLLDPGGN